MFLRRAFIVCLCLGLSSVAACSSASKQVELSACSLLTAQTLSSLTDLSFSEGQSVDAEANQGCVWKADERGGEVSVFVDGADSESDFDSRAEDAAKSFGSSTPFDVSGATKSVEFGDFGVVLMTVKDRLIQVQQSLPATVSSTIHQDLARAVARNAS